MGFDLQRLLSDTRTAIVTAGEPAPMHESADSASRIAFLAESGVVGRISRCDAGWCRFEVGGRKGHIRTERVWGVDARETLD